MTLTTDEVALLESSLFEFLKLTPGYLAQHFDIVTVFMAVMGIYLERDPESYSAIRRVYDLPKVNQYIERIGFEYFPSLEVLHEQTKIKGVDSCHSRSMKTQDIHLQAVMTLYDALKEKMRFLRVANNPLARKPEIIIFSEN